MRHLTGAQTTTREDAGEKILASGITQLKRTCSESNTPAKKSANVIEHYFNRRYSDTSLSTIYKQAFPTVSVCCLATVLLNVAEELLGGRMIICYQ